MKREQDQVSTSSIRTPVQRRSRDKFERIFIATETLFATKGPQATSIQDIIEEAGCSVGAFYQRFPDRETLVTAVLERFEEAVKAEISGLFETVTHTTLPLHQVIAEVVDFIFLLYAQKGGLFRSLILLSESYPAARQSGTNIIAFAATKFGDVLMQRKTELAHADPRLAATIALRMVVGVLDTRLILSGGAQEEDVPLEIMQGELERSVQQYLGVFGGSQHP